MNLVPRQWISSMFDGTCKIAQLKHHPVLMDGVGRFNLLRNQLRYIDLQLTREEKIQLFSYIRNDAGFYENWDIECCKNVVLHEMLTYEGHDIAMRFSPFNSGSLVRFVEKVVDHYAERIRKQWKILNCTQPNRDQMEDIISQTFPGLISHIHCAFARSLPEHRFSHGQLSSMVEVKFLC